MKKSIKITKFISYGKGNTTAEVIGSDGKTKHVRLAKDGNWRSKEGLTYTDK